MNPIDIRTTGFDVLANISIGGYECKQTYKQLIDLFNAYLRAWGIPHVNASAGCLERDKNLWLCLTVGLDAKGTWANNIFENSRYARLQVVCDSDGLFVVEYFSGSLPRHLGKKFRKCRVKTLGDVVSKVTTWIGGAK